MLRFLDRSTQVTLPAFLASAPVMAPHPLPTSSTLSCAVIGTKSTMFSLSGDKWYNMGQLFRCSIS